MTPTEEHVMMIGPWGWIGWAAMAAVSALYVLLWRSSRASELRKLNEALADARKMIDDLRASEQQLIRERNALREQFGELHGQYLELRGSHSQLNAAFGKLGGVVAALQEDLNRERALRDQQFAELMRLRGKHGEL